MDKPPVDADVLTDAFTQPKPLDGLNGNPAIPPANLPEEKATAETNSIDDIHPPDPILPGAGISPERKTTLPVLLLFAGALLTITVVIVLKRR